MSSPLSEAVPSHVVTQELEFAVFFLRAEQCAWLRVLSKGDNLVGGIVS